MNYIISESNDEITDNVISWLLSYNCEVVRLNYDSSFDNLLSFGISSEESCLKINTSKVLKTWNRRARLNFLDHSKIDSEIYKYLKRENETLLKSIEIYLKNNSEYVGSWLKEVENYKVTQLLCAKQNGLVILDTIITNSKKELLQFHNKHKNIIVKDLRYPVYISKEKEEMFSKGVLLVTEEMINALDDIFVPMLFQKKTEKQFEIRVFFFREKYYAMAIL